MRSLKHGHTLISDYSTISAHRAGADRTAAFANREAQALVHGDRRDQLDFQLTLSPGITISVPSGNFATPVTSVVRK